MEIIKKHLSLYILNITQKKNLNLKNYLIQLSGFYRLFVLLCV